MTGPLSRDEILAELEFLATVEHALIVEYLSVLCALGHDLPADEGGPLTDEARNAAGAASALAQSEMFTLADINRALLKADRFAPLERAAAIPSDSGPDIALDPPTEAQLRRLLEREDAIATAVDKRYARLLPAVTSAGFEPDLLAELQGIIEGGARHREALGGLRDALGDPPPVDVLRATRRDTNDEFEQRLLEASDRGYRVVVGVLRERFTPQSTTPASLPFSAMQALDSVNRLLAQRGFLPPFTP
jgi:hypothetical protein